MAAQEKHLQPFAVMPRREFDQRALYKALKPNWLGNLGHPTSAWHLILWDAYLLPRLTSLWKFHFHTSGNHNSPRKWHRKAKWCLCATTMASSKLQSVNLFEIKFKILKEKIRFSVP